MPIVIALLFGAGAWTFFASRSRARNEERERFFVWRFRVMDETARLKAVRAFNNSDRTELEQGAKFCLGPTANFYGYYQTQNTATGTTDFTVTFKYTGVEVDSVEANHCLSQAL